MASPFTRREFLKTSAAAALSVGIGTTNGWISRSTHGRPIRSRWTIRACASAALGIGTGSNNGQVQRDMGQEAFTRLVHAAYERGITYIDTADNYKTHGNGARSDQGPACARSCTSRPRCRGIVRRSPRIR